MEEQPILVAEFEKPKLKRYFLLAGLVISVCTVVGIPLMLIWVPIALLIMDKVIDRYYAELTPTKLIIRKGFLVRTEKVVPLEKITDLGLKQGPIQRHMGLESITVETAGSSGGGEGGALVNLLGIKDTRGFRKAVLDQRDLVAAGSATPAPVSIPSDGGDVLERIATSVERIERHLRRDSDAS
ncbi:MAG: PH domain-containing protein [Phycisphaerales bacterium JB043]